MDTLKIFQSCGAFVLKVGTTVTAFYPDYSRNNIIPRYKATVTRILGSDKTPYCEISIAMPDNTILVKIDSHGDQRGVSKGWRIAEYFKEVEQQLEMDRQEALAKEDLERQLQRALVTFNSKSPYIYVRHVPTEKTQALIDLLNELNKIVS